MAKDIYKKVKINDREYVIKKFDAMTGLKIGRLVIAKAAPSFRCSILAMEKTQKPRKKTRSAFTMP